MNLNNFHKIVADIPVETQEYVKGSMDILDRIHELLDKKFGGKQILLAKKLGKSESEVSKWLSGVQNFTIKTLIKLQVAFGEPIIAVCTNDDNNSTFEQVRCRTNGVTKTWYADYRGDIDEVNDYMQVDFKKTNQSKELQIS